ncbi:hypothetical protein [Sorangium cellulosum]|nr:hypothetical protein [Sorangium cellulosum]
MSSCWIERGARTSSALGRVSPRRARVAGPAALLAVAAVLFIAGGGA